jgi:ligand-binding sensor domain-containing protein
MPRSARIRLFRNLARGSLLLLLGAMGAPSGLGLSNAQLQYTRQVWHVQEGLPEDTVQAMQQTPDGYLWIGTTGGLARFDGTRFLTYRRSSGSALRAAACSIWITGNSTPTPRAKA